MIVVDASVAVKWFVVEAGHDEAVSLLNAENVLVAPDLVLLETLNVLRRKMKRGELRAEQVTTAAGHLASFFDELVATASLADRAFGLAQSLDHAVYDCAYLACAVERRGVLVTADQVFFEKATHAGYGSFVERLADVSAKGRDRSAADKPDLPAGRLTE